MSPRGPRTRIGRGLYEDRSGIDAEVWVGGLHEADRFSKRKLGRARAIADAKAWQDKARAALRRKAKSSPHGPFVDDVHRYLKTATSMPSLSDQTRYLEDWCGVFGPRRRDSISSPEIKAQLETWHTQRGWSASSLNHRRTALQRLWSALDGKSAENPVKDVPRYHEPDPLPRGLPWPLIRSILKQMPQRVTALRLALITWTGMAHSTLARVTAADVDFRHRTLARPGRKKGQGTRAQVVPITRRAVWYFRLMAQANAWGTWHRSNMRRDFRIACRKVEAEALKQGQTLSLAGVRPYDLRHSFGSLVYASTHDLQATAILMGHGSLTTTRRYTLAAVPAALSAAVAKVEAKTPKNPEPAPDPAKADPGKLLIFNGRARSSGG